LGQGKSSDREEVSTGFSKEQTQRETKVNGTDKEKRPRNLGGKCCAKGGRKKLGTRGPIFGGGGTVNGRGVKGKGKV